MTLARLLFGIAAREVEFERRGFRGGTPPARRRIEEIGRAFVAGYHAALEDGRDAPLASRLDAIDLEQRGFAYEGAAMGLALLDAITPWRRDRWRRFVEGRGSAHAYMVHVGAGWAMARLGGTVGRWIAGRDPVLCWLVLDGLGFHEGYFHWPEAVEARRVPARLQGYARRAFDQGLGRSLWFVEGAEPERIRRTIGRFEPGRAGDLWSGVGLAAAYAGGVDRPTLGALREAAGSHRPSVAQGAAFGAKARQRAGNETEHTRLACQVLCGMDAGAASSLTDRARVGLETEGTEPPYEAWRRRLRDHWAAADSRGAGEPAAPARPGPLA